MDDLISGLKKVPASQLTPLLDELEFREPPDAKVGIYLIDLGLPIIKHEGLVFRFYGARVLPGKYVKPHYHTKGIEPYYFVAGEEGEMSLGKVEDGKVQWESLQIVQPQEAIVIKENQVHCFRNISKQPFDFAFACPAEHLIDHDEQHPHGDRYFTAHLVNGVPGDSRISNQDKRKSYEANS